MLGDYERCVPVYQAVRVRANARRDKVFEVRATRTSRPLAVRQGNAAQSVEMFDAVLPLIERDRNPDLYATLIGNLGNSLITLGEFDRALMLHTEALEVFSARGDDSQTARELAALASIQFRSGNVEQALATLENALPLYERAQDQAGLVSALRLAGNAAAELGQHDTALDYLRRAERQDKNGITIDRTRVLIAGELRALGDLRGADRLLTQALLTKNEPIASRCAGRARHGCAKGRGAAPKPWRICAKRTRIYARLKLDFNRIDTSSALALALLAAGDMSGAGAAADTAVGIETRIRVNSANPELRARFLSASYAPYEARIEVGTGRRRSPAMKSAALESVPGGRGDPRAFAGGPSRARRAAPATRRAIENAERLRERMTALQVDLERRMRKGELRRRRRSRDAAPHRRGAGASRSPDARPARRPVELPVLASPNRSRTCRPHCRPIRRCWRTSSAISVRMPGC